MNKNERTKKLMDQLRNGSTQEISSAIIDLQQMCAKEALPALLAFVDSPDAGVRANAASAMGTLGDENTGPALLPLLDDPDALVRLEAAESLGLLQYKKGIDALMKRLKTESDPLVRVHVAEALGRIKDTSASESLIAALNDRDEGVRAYAADALGNLGDTRAVPFLIRRLEIEQALFTKAFILAALYRLGIRESLESLVRLSEISDDTLAITILNLAVELATAENVSQLIEFIHTATNQRKNLLYEVNSLVEKLKSSI